MILLIVNEGSDQTVRFADWSAPLRPKYGQNAHIYMASLLYIYSNKPGHNISYKLTCAPSEDSDQPAHPRSLIIVFAEHTVVHTVGIQ